jgi:hypothetical protein
MQAVLSTEYSKSLKEVLRFVIIGTNLAVFYYFSGVRIDKFGPDIDEQKPFRPINMPKLNPHSTTSDPEADDPLRKSSILDMIAFILAIYLALKQLTFGRPEIDSFREKIILLPQEKKASLILVLFILFKTVYQFFWSYYVEYRSFEFKNGREIETVMNVWGRRVDPKMKRTFQNVTDEIRFRDPFLLKKASDLNDGVYILLRTNFKNLYLLISSIICLVSSHSFKLEIQISEKRMILSIVKFFAMLAQVGLASALTYIMFLGENKCICLVFIIVLVFDALRAIRLALYTKRKRNQPDIKEYLLALKWVAFGIMSCIISGPFFYHLIRFFAVKQYIADGKTENLTTTNLEPPLDRYKTYLTWMDYFMLFFQREDGMGSLIMPRIVEFVNKESCQGSLPLAFLYCGHRVHC